MTQHRFPTVKLLDYEADLAMLEKSTSPFAAIVLAHLQAQQTLDAGEIRQLFRLIDWLMDLPRELERDFIVEIHRYEEEKKIPYVTSGERLSEQLLDAKGWSELLATP